MTTGVRFSVNFTGTQTAFVANLKFAAGTTASADAPDQDFVAAGAQIISSFNARAPSNAGWGTTLSVDTINANMYDELDGIIVVTVAGNLQLFHGSGVAAASTIKAGSALIINKL